MENNAFEYIKDVTKDDIDFSRVKRLYDLFKSQRTTLERDWTLIFNMYSGKFWKLVKEKLPPHQILPETNYVEYIAKSITNSVYSTNYVANVLAKSHQDNTTAEKINKFLESRNEKMKMASIFPKLGLDATLYLYSGIQFGWDSHMIETGANKTREQGGLIARHIPHDQLLLDYSADYYLDGEAIFITRRVNIYDLQNEEVLKDAVTRYIEDHKDNKGLFSASNASTINDGSLHVDNTPQQPSTTVHLIEGYIREGKDKIDHVYILNNEFVIGLEKNIQPSTFPIRILFSEYAENGSYATPMIKKVVPNITTLNILDSIEATQAYLAQNRPKLINTKSGLNLRSFAKHGNNPKLAFPVNGNPRDVVSYVDQQIIPQMDMLKARLENSIFMITGVDLRYTGRDTGSVQTTGGVDLAQQRVMMMTDNLRINALERFTEEISELQIDFYIAHGNKYSIVSREPSTHRVMQNADDFIDFTKIDENNFEYTMSAGPYLPKNKMRLAEAATRLLEMQGQYNYQPPIITHEEWLMYQDIPQKDILLQRMRMQMQQNDKEELEADLINFASLIQQGMSEQEAVDTIVQEKQMRRDNPGLANSGTSVANSQGPVL